MRVLSHTFAYNLRAKLGCKLHTFENRKLHILHSSDVDPRSVVNKGVEDKHKKYAKPIADQIDGCIALVVNTGGGMRKDLSKLVYRLARKRTESVLGAAGW